MFKKARQTLTGWYLLILTLIIGVFTVITYQVQTRELDLILQKQISQKDAFEQVTGTTAPALFDAHIEFLENSKQRILNQILVIDLIMLLGAGVAAYFLAGKTLQPIEEMHEEQNQFISDASHELRTPLTAMRTELEVNLKDENISLEQAKALLQSNQEEVLRLQTIIDRLLNLLRNKSLPARIYQPIHVQELAQTAIKSVSALAHTKNITITDETQTVTVEGNKEALTEVLVILLDNAIKYSYEGGEIKIKTYPTKDRAIVLVEDKGIGISPEHLPHIFDRFFRADESRTKNNEHGYGLGLSIAQKVIDEHHGHITVTSTINKGSTFIVELPLARSNPS